MTTHQTALLPHLFQNSSTKDNGEPDLPHASFQTATMIIPQAFHAHSTQPWASLDQDSGMEWNGSRGL